MKIKIYFILFIYLFQITIASDIDNNSTFNGILCYSLPDFKGNKTILEPGSYLVNKLEKISSMKIPIDYEVIFTNSLDCDPSSSISYPDVLDTQNSSDESSTDYKNIKVDKYKYVYIAKVNKNNSDDGIEPVFIWNENLKQAKYISTKKITELKTNVRELIIDACPNLKELPSVNLLNNLQSIKILFNSFQNSSNSEFKKILSQIVDLISKYNNLKDIYINRNIPEYLDIRGSKLFGFNLSKLPSNTSITEMYLINCNKLKDIPNLSKYTNLQKIFLYGTTLENASENTWNSIINKMFKLTEKSPGFVSTTGKLTHIRLPENYNKAIKSMNIKFSQLKYIYAPSIISIDAAFFKNFSELEEVRFNSLKTVNKETFSGCKKIKIINMPSCETVGDDAFYDNYALEYANMPNIQTIGKSSFSYNNAKKFQLGDIEKFKEVFKSENISGIYLPKCTKIEEKAFCSSKSHKSAIEVINIPLCNCINKNAFYLSPKLKEVYLDSTIEIKDSAFEGCTSLKILYIPQVKIIRQSAFETCYSLEKVGDTTKIANLTCELKNVKTIEDKAFKMHDDKQLKIKNLSLPLCETIGIDAFCRWRSMESLSAPSCMLIKKEAFYDPYRLKTIDLPIVNEIEERAFIYNQQSFTGTLSLPNCKKIGKQAFGGSNWARWKMSTVNIPLCSSIDSQAFKGCKDLKTLNAPKLSSITKKAILKHAAKPL